MDAQVEPARRAATVDLWHAAKRGDMEVVTRALAAGGVPNEPAAGYSALHLAVTGGHLEVIHALVEAGADLDSRDSLDRTPLMRAVEKIAPHDLWGPKVSFLGLDDARDAVERRVLPMVVALVDSGSDVNASMNHILEDARPLYFPVQRGRRRTVLTLLRAGALVETTERFELTFTGKELPPPFTCYRKRPDETHLRVWRLQDKEFKGEIVSVDGKPITADFCRNDLDTWIFNPSENQPWSQPYRVGFFLRERHYSPESERNGSNKSTLALMKAIESAGSFDEYARRLQRDVHVAIITKCFQEKLPLDIKTALTTYLWKWGGA